MKIAQITRQLSFEDIKPKKKIRYMQILERLLYGNKTAKEIAVELFDLGFTNTSGRNSKENLRIHRAVTVYKITQKGYEAFNYNHIPRID